MSYFVTCNGSCWLAWTCQPCGNRICKILFWQWHLLFICCDYVSCTHFCSKFRIHIKRIKFTSQFCNSEITIILDKSDSAFCVRVCVCVCSQYKMVTHFCFHFLFCVVMIALIVSGKLAEGLSHTYICIHSPNSPPI